MLYLLLFVLSFPAYAAVVEPDKEFIHADGFRSYASRSPRTLDGYFTADLKDWRFDINYGQGHPLQGQRDNDLPSITPTSACPFGTTGCNSAEWVTPNHLMFRHEAGAAETMTVDLFFGPTLHAELHYYYGSLWFAGDGPAAVIPEPSIFVALSLFITLACLKMSRASAFRRFLHTAQRRFRYC